MRQRRPCPTSHNRLKTHRLSTGHPRLELQMRRNLRFRHSPDHKLQHILKQLAAQRRRFLHPRNLVCVLHLTQPRDQPLNRNKKTPPSNSRHTLAYPLQRRHARLPGVKPAALHPCCHQPLHRQRRRRLLLHHHAQAANLSLGLRLVAAIGKQHRLATGNRQRCTRPGKPRQIPHIRHVRHQQRIHSRCCGSFHRRPPSCALIHSLEPLPTTLNQSRIALKPHAPFTILPSHHPSHPATRYHGLCSVFSTPPKSPPQRPSIHPTVTTTLERSVAAPS